MKVINFDEITSTNDFLKENYKIYNNLTFVKTKFQTKGRGQFERVWKSNKDENLLFSFILKDIYINKIETIKNIINYTLLNFLKDYNIEGIFKEPNDILVDYKKILGILIETKTKTNEEYEYVITGIGININQDEFSNLNATSFKLLNNKVFDIETLFNKLSENLYKNLIKVI